jgi:SAM-dependent methyltransferase
MLYENPDLYDALLPTSEQHLSFYMSLAQQYPGPVLELACGSGQLTVPIALQHSQVLGLDSSPQMLAAARRRALAAGSTLELVQGDMREFELGRQFSLIFVARNSLLHLHRLEDFAALFSTVRRHLAPGGIFAFDIFNPDVRMLARPAGQRYPVLRVTDEHFGELSVEEINEYDPATQVSCITWFISAPGRPDAWVAPLHLRSIFPEELKLLVAVQQFRLVRRDGDLRGGTFAAVSPRQVCLCQPL